MSESGAPASTSAAETASVRGVAFGWANVAVSMTMPAIRAVGQRAVVGVERDAEPDREQRDHLARRGGVPDRSSRPRPRASFEAWWSMMTRGRRPNSSACRSPTSPTRVERAAVGDHEQVVVGVGVRVGPEALDARQEVVERRDRVRCRPGRPPRRAPRRGARRRASRPSVSASGFSWLTARTRRAPRSRSTTTVGHGVEVRRRDRRSSAADRGLGVAAPAARYVRFGGAAAAGRPPAAAPRRGRPRAAAARPASAATRRSRHPPRGSGPPRARARSCRTRVPRSAVSSSSTWRSGMRLIRSRVPSSWRTNGIARPSAAIVAVALGRLADDAHPDLGVPQVRRRLDAR